MHTQVVTPVKKVREKMMTKRRRKIGTMGTRTALKCRGRPVQ